MTAKRTLALLALFASAVMRSATLFRFSTAKGVWCGENVISVLGIVGVANGNGAVAHFDLLKAALATPSCQDSSNTPA
jgi:hypothetical protein